MDKLRTINDNFCVHTNLCNINKFLRGPFELHLQFSIRRRDESKKENGTPLLKLKPNANSLCNGNGKRMPNQTSGYERLVVFVFDNIAHCGHRR